MGLYAVAPNNGWGNTKLPPPTGVLRPLALRVQSLLLRGRKTDIPRQLLCTIERSNGVCIAVARGGGGGDGLCSTNGGDSPARPEGHTVPQAPP